MNSRIEEIEEQVRDLLRERNYLVEEFGIHEDYVVFRTDIEQLTTDAVVLIPTKNKDEINKLAEVTGNQEMLRWCRDFNEDSCFGKCPVVATPRCCMACEQHDSCEEELERCDKDCGRRRNDKG